MRDLIIGSEALKAGWLTRADLRRCYTRILPDVYALKGKSLSFRDWTVAAWLWSQRQGVVAGQTAAGLRRAKWASDFPIELIWPNHRAPTPLRTYNDTLLPGEWEYVAGLPVTTVARTAFDLSRRGKPAAALARLDALTRATPVNPDEVLAIAQRHRYVAGLAQMRRMLELMDGGAESPKESWLRLVLIDAGFPWPQTQIPVLSPTGYRKYSLDMGWPELMISVEYDGEHHRESRLQYGHDITRSEYIAGVGWLNIRVIADNTEASIIRRVRAAWAQRGATP